MQTKAKLEGHWCRLSGQVSALEDVLQKLLSFLEPVGCSHTEEFLHFPEGHEIFVKKNNLEKGLVGSYLTFIYPDFY